MGARTMGLSKRFDKYKSQGMTDDAAMKKAMEESQKETMDSRKADAAAKKKKEQGVINRAAKGLKSVFGPGHSPAGRRYLAGRVKK